MKIKKTLGIKIKKMHLMNNKKKRKKIYFFMSNLISKVFVFISNGIEFYPLI